MAADLTPVVALLPVSWQRKAKAIAGVVMTVATAVLPVLVVLGVNLPTPVTLVVTAVLALLSPIAIYAVPNVDVAAGKHEAPPA